MLLKRSRADPELNDDDQVGGGGGQDAEEQGPVDGEVTTPCQVLPRLKQCNKGRQLLQQNYNEVLVQGLTLSSIGSSLPVLLCCRELITDCVASVTAWPVEQCTYSLEHAVGLFGPLSVQKLLCFRPALPEQSWSYLMRAIVAQNM